ncbi:MAG: DUF4065 domain-containing protein [Candidatus Margulisbacteria bacterium]|nr:DUF4065 domain-containing protein [Candidatus Margulisiibacteriota bacterium]
MFGKYLERLRIKHGISQESLANSLDITRPTYTAIEKGKRALKVPEARILADTFNLPLANFLNEKDIEIVSDGLSKSDISDSDESNLRISVPEEKKDKFKQVLLYILSKIGSRPNIGETVLYKILYFIDFDYYEKYESQLMGLRYFKNHYGPTPYIFKSLVEEMINNNEVEKIKSSYFTKEQTKYLPHIEPDLTILTGQEMEHIDWELSRFEHFSAQNITERSHNDVPWISAEEGQPIQYESVFYRTAETSVRNYDDEEVF